MPSFAQRKHCLHTGCLPKFTQLSMGGTEIHTHLCLTSDSVFLANVLYCFGFSSCWEIFMCLLKQFCGNPETVMVSCLPFKTTCSEFLWSFKRVGVTMEEKQQKCSINVQNTHEGSSYISDRLKIIYPKLIFNWVDHICRGHLRPSWLTGPGFLFWEWEKIQYSKQPKIVLEEWMERPNLFLISEHQARGLASTIWAALFTAFKL